MGRGCARKHRIGADFIKNSGGSVAARLLGGMAGGEADARVPAMALFPVHEGQKSASRMAPWSVKIRRSVGEALRRELDGPGTAADDDGMKEAKK